MKQLSKRILAMLCVTVMLFTCCLSGLSFAVSADAAGDNAPVYGNKWTIFYPGEDGETLDYAVGARFEKAVTGFNAVIPETYEMSDLALYMHITLDRAAVTAFETSGTVELSQNTMDQAELSWTLTAPQWQVGDNVVLLSLASAGHYAGTNGVSFDLYQPINFFRMFATPGKAEFTEASSLTIWEIAIVDKTAAGVEFGEDDTYLMLSEPLSTTPNTIEASVKVPAPKTEWDLCNRFAASTGFAISWSNGTSAATYGNTWTTDATLATQPDAGTLYAEFKPNGKTNTSGDHQVWCPVFTSTFTPLDIPKGVGIDDLMFSGWVYISDVSAVETTAPWFWLSSTSDYAVSSGGLKYNNMFTDIKNGWNYFEMPLSNFSLSSASYPLDINDISGVSMRAINVKWLDSTPDDGVAGTIEDQITVRYADFRLSVIGSEEEEEKLPTSWSIGYPNGGRYIGSGFTKDGVYDAEGNTPAPYMVNIGASIAKDEYGIPNGTPYYAVTLNKGGQMAMATQTFTVDFPEEYTKDDLALAFWYYSSTGEVPGGYLELTSSGKADYQEITFYHSTFLPKSAGWHYVVMPLSKPSVATSGDYGVFDYTKANYIRWVGGGAMSAVAEMRVSEMKFIVLGAEEQTEWTIGSGFTESSGFKTTWSNGTSSVTYGNTWTTDATLEKQPLSGTPYAEFKPNGKTNTSGDHQVWCPVFTETFTALDIPEGTELSDLKFSGWMYISDASAVETTNPWFWLSSTASYDVANGGLVYKNLFANYPLVDGWNYFDIPLADFVPWSSAYFLDVQDISGLCMRSLNLTWLDSTPDDGVAGTIEDQVTVRYADFRLSLIADDAAEKEEGWYISKSGAGVASGSAASGVSDGSGTGYNTLPKGLTYTIGSSMSGGTVSFNAAIPETYTKNDLDMTFWLWVEDADAFTSGYIELTSSGTWDVDEWCWNIGHLKNSGNITLIDGWNFVRLPLVWGAKSGSGTFDLYKANFVRFHTKSCLIGISDMKLVPNKETQLEKDGEVVLETMWTSATKDTMVTDGSFGEPEGLPYHQSVFSGNHTFMQKTFTPVSVPKGSLKRDLNVNFWLYVDDVTKISRIGNLELSSSGKCDSMEYERNLSYLMSTLKNGWNFVSIPLTTDWYHTTNGGDFNEFSINFIRWHSMMPVEGATATVRVANMKISSASGDYPNWDFVHWDKGWGRQAAGSQADYTSGNLIAEYLPVGPSTGSYYAEYTAADSVSAGSNWCANMQINRSDGSIENEWLTIPASYRREHMMVSFWLYISDADLLDTAKQPTLYITSNSNYSYNTDAIKYTFTDFALVDGWNRITVPLTAFTDVDGTYSIANTKVFRFENFYVGYDAVVRYADIRMEATAEPTLNSSAVNVTADDMIIFGNTNTADENPIALFVNVKGNVCWVWGDKQYVTDYNVANGNWIDLALVRDTAAGKFYLYADGEVVAEADASDTADIIPTVAHSIGADGLGVTFCGMIADVRVWSDARTAAEIADNRVSKYGNKTNGLTPETEGLIDAWFMVGDLSHVLGDTVTASINGNDLVFMGSRADDWFDYDQTQYDFLYDEEGNPDYYTMVFIPDIQNLVTGKYTAWWMAEAQWIADNIEKENIVHVVGAGDSTWNNTVAEYERAQTGFDLFANKVSWSNLIGNHDYVWSNPTRDTSRYNTYFGLDYIQSTEGGKNFVGYFDDPYGISEAENAYYRFEVNGVQWMILQLEFHPRAHVLTWANEILAQYPNDNVILTTHSYLDGKGNYCAQGYTYIDGTNGVKGESDAQYGGYIGNTPEKVWTEVAYNNPNVKMILCGHSASSDCSIVYREDANVNGYMVPQMMINAQNLDNNDYQTGGYFEDLGVGLLGIMRFSADGTQVAMQYYSPYYEKSYSPSSNEITLTLDIDTTCGHENVTETTVDATCTENGSKTVTCDDCGEVLSTETIEAKGHTEEVVKGYDATCTENGLTDGVKCAVCGAILKAQETIDALGHDEGKTEGTFDPTNTEPGYTGDKVCGVCGDVLEKGTVIPTLIPGEIGEDGVYRENGKYVPYKGLIKVDGYYYYVNNHGAVLKDVSYRILDTNGYDALDSNIKKGASYYFDAEGHLVLGKNGLYGGVYYENDAPVPYKGLIEWEGKLYYVNNGGKVVTGRYFISKLNGLVTSGGAYYFDETGAMVGTGVYEGFYYKNGKATPYAGMVAVGDDVYYVIANATLKTGRYSIVNNNSFTKGIYYFGEDGKMVRNTVVDGFYYGEDGRCIAYRGLVEATDGNYYYVNNNGAVVTNNANFYVTKTNGLVARGLYAFDEKGAMLRIDTYEELVDALANSTYVSLAGSIAVNGNLSLPAGATLNGNGYTLTGAQIYMGEGSTVTRVCFNGTASEIGSNIYAHNVSATVSFCIFDNFGYEAIQATTTVPNKTVKIHSNTFVDTADTAYRYVHVEIPDLALRDDAANGYKLILTNNYFVDIDSCDNDAISVCGVLPENLTVSGNRASAASVEAAKAECWFGEHTTGAWVQYDVDAFETVETP